MKNLVFIPTYWTSKEEKHKTVFDHPSHISSNGTLSRTLQSFVKNKLVYDIFILPVPLKKDVENKINSIVKKFPNLNINILTKKDYTKIIKKIKKTNTSAEFKSEINVDDYPGVRNFGLLYAIINDYDNIIMIDDDEVVCDDDYFNKAIDGMGLKINGKYLFGKTGYYINKDRDYKLSQKDPNLRKLWLKDTHINDSIKKAISGKKRFNTTTIALGGNMVINKKLFTHVPFDPYITRGEDIDYMMNAKHLGYLFPMDKNLKIIHLPPKTITPGWIKLKRDIYRFIYSREKMKLLNIDLKDTLPYPGFFLGNNLEEKIKKTNSNYANYHKKKNQSLEVEEYTKNCSFVIEDATRHAKQSAKKYFSFQKNWRKLSKQI